MEVAELFDTGTGIDLETPTAGVEALVEGYMRDTDRDLRGALADTAVVREGARIVAFLLEDFDVPDRARTVVHDLAVLVVAVGRETPQLRDWTDDADLDALASAGGGAFGDAAGPMSAVFRDVVAVLRDLPGWPINEPAVLGRLKNAASAYAQGRRLEAVAKDAVPRTLAAAARGVWKEALVEVACVVCNDDTRARKSSEADTIGQLLISVVGLASELGPFLTGDGDGKAVELVTQRFAVLPAVIKLNSPQIARALRATLELEVRDLLDALGHLDPFGARGQLVRRMVLAMLTFDGSAHAVVDATSMPAPSRDDVMKRMRAIAMADGKVTTDERALLRRFDTQLHTFQDLVARIEEDRSIDFEEFRQLRDTRQSMLDDLFRVALSDAHISDDERQLLLRAMELVPTLRSRAQPC